MVALTITCIPDVLNFVPSVVGGVRAGDRWCDAVARILLWQEACLPSSGALLLWQAAVYYSP